MGARALAALQQGVDPSGMNQQQFLVYPTVGGIPMIISTDPAQQALTKVWTKPWLRQTLLFERHFFAR